MKVQKIALEEHIALPGNTSEQFLTFYDNWPEILHRLLDIHGQLLADMDASGIGLAILSLNAPAIQANPSKRQAIDMARQANDYLAEQVVKNPVRFQALAALPLQDPEAAAQELTRCVKDLGFKGALVNGYSSLEDGAVAYYDQPEYWDFWGVVQALEVPFYLHPRDMDLETKALRGHPWLRNSGWAFGVETATHALRLMSSGLFDKHPDLTIILGHLGETLPHVIWRIDHRIGLVPRGIPAKRPLAHYLRNNFYVTTSGNFCTQALMNTILSLGSDRILFSTDYPFERMSEAADWFDTVEISEADRIKIGSANAEKLFKLATHNQKAAASV